MGRDRDLGTSPIWYLLDVVVVVYTCCKHPQEDVLLKYSHKIDELLSHDCKCRLRIKIHVHLPELQSTPFQILFHPLTWLPTKNKRTLPHYICFIKLVNKCMSTSTCICTIIIMHHHHCSFSNNLKIIKYINITTKPSCMWYVALSLTCMALR